MYREAKSPFIAPAALFATPTEPTAPPWPTSYGPRIEPLLHFSPTELIDFFGGEGASTASSPAPTFTFHGRVRCQTAANPDISRLKGSCRRQDGLGTTRVLATSTNLKRECSKKVAVNMREEALFIFFIKENLDGLFNYMPNFTRFILVSHFFICLFLLCFLSWGKSYSVALTGFTGKRRVQNEVQCPSASIWVV